MDLSALGDYRLSKKNLKGGITKEPPDLQKIG